MMLEHAQKIAPDPKYEIQDIADQFEDGEFCIKILFLPVAHPELNPIELAWAYLKNNISSQNFEFKMDAVLALAKGVLENITQQMFFKFCEHSKKEEGSTGQWRK